MENENSGLWKELVKDRKANYKFLKCFKARKSERARVWAGMPATKGAARRHKTLLGSWIRYFISTGDVWKAPLLDLFIPGSSIEESLEPGVLWWAAALRSNESPGSAGSHPKMWKELGNEDREQRKKQSVIKIWSDMGAAKSSKSLSRFWKEEVLETTEPELWNQGNSLNQDQKTIPQDAEGAEKVGQVPHHLFAFCDC